MPADHTPFHTLTVCIDDVLENQRPYPATADEDDNADFELARSFLESLNPEAQTELRQELSIIATGDRHYQNFDDTCADAYRHILSRAKDRP